MLALIRGGRPEPHDGKGVIPVRLAVDVGYGFTKAVAESSARRVSFPSVIAPVDADVSLERALGADQVAERLTVVAGDDSRQDWLFGHAALAAPGAVRPWDSSATGRQGYDTLIYAALGSGALAPEVDVDLVLGLPFGVYGSQRAALREALSGRTAYIHVGGHPPSRVRFRSVLVLPQAAGAYYATALDAEGGVRDASLGSQNVGIVDVGFRTTDYFVMRHGAGGLRPVKELSGSLDTGLVDVYEGVRRRVQAQTGNLVRSLRIEAALSEGGGILMDMGRPIDLRPWTEEEAARAARRIADEMRVVWGEQLRELTLILLAGGGAMLMEAGLRVLHPQTRLVEDPVFANAAGFLAVGRSLAAEARA